MTRDQKKWITVIGLAIVAVVAWLRFSYPTFSFVDLSVSKQCALKTACAYLEERFRVDPRSYRSAVVLQSQDAADRYLQKTIGFRAEQEFIAKNKIDLFAWRIRFFKEKEKEEYGISVSAATGKIISFTHTIEDTAQRPTTDLAHAQEIVQQFLIDEYSVNFQDYTLKEKTTKKYDNRVDHSFCWQKNSVNIPWNNDKNSGTGKLLIKARISGSDILFFDKNIFDIPDDFRRFIEHSKQSGQILTSVFSLLSYLLIMAATYIVVTRRQNIVFQVTQSLYTKAGVLLFFLLIFFQANNIQEILHDYPTTASLKIFFSEISLGLLVAGIFLAATTVIPAMAGEAVAQENKSSARGFFYYLRSTLFSRHVASMIFLGYLAAIILLGIQSIIFYLGQNYLGVWAERPHITQTSSATWPFITILIVGFRASLCEETLYRLFGIEYGKKVLKNTIFACLLTSIVWGFGHSHYQIFPSWFRGIEVSLLGLILSLLYVHYGIIPVLVSHYVFDTFWGGAGFLFGKAQPFDLMSCLGVIALPLIFAMVAFFRNKPDVQIQKNFLLKDTHRYNLKILKFFLSNPENTRGRSSEEIRAELIASGWDVVVIDEALKETKEIH